MAVSRFFCWCETTLRRVERQQCCAAQAWSSVVRKKTMCHLWAHHQQMCAPLCKYGSSSPALWVFPSSSKTRLFPPKGWFRPRNVSTSTNHRRFPFLLPVHTPFSSDVEKREENISDFAPPALSNRVVFPPSAPFVRSTFSTSLKVSQATMDAPEPQATTSAWDAQIPERLERTSNLLVRFPTLLLRVPSLPSAWEKQKKEGGIRPPTTKKGGGIHKSKRRKNKLATGVSRSQRVFRREAQRVIREDNVRELRALLDLHPGQNVNVERGALLADAILRSAVKCMRLLLQRGADWREWEVEWALRERSDMRRKRCDLLRIWRILLELTADTPDRQAFLRDICSASLCCGNIELARFLFRQHHVRWERDDETRLQMCRRCHPHLTRNLQRSSFVSPPR
uniref:Uncharacterized protein n=1 Tax=Palpitomonas bilix TaxID=652834 RepID=A0A7S3G7W7_9EUKA|mmetsp:Transcript_29137/g.74893  ORF Transcript_29137/g.74893 Transcript_29137/m.74893 type:complete len:396 (+) Transcript_29137:911-2098(+)